MEIARLTVRQKIDQIYVLKPGCERFQELSGFEESSRSVSACCCFHDVYQWTNQ